ncbi:hypothetical protein [Demequina oxidasica]|uniref:hypothetical protein n=1 Tax=Demequina oxidasica TaxID=676199 RepID=UPI000783EF8B|nr:hypothetical protein [Demequina oxidasica]
MAIDLSHYGFPFSIEELPDLDRAVLAVVVNDNDSQLAAIAGPRSADFAEQANAVATFIKRLHIAEPNEGFSSTVERAGFLAHTARDDVGRAFPELNAEVVRRAGNRYAFLNR